MDFITRSTYLLKNPALFFDTKREDAVLLNLPEEISPEIDLLRREIDSLKTDCGCKVGSVVLVLSMLSYFFYLSFASSVPSGFTAKLVNGIIVFFAGACIGKLLGILRARYHYKRAFQQLVVLLGQKHLTVI
jgi:hypothetical protein